MAAAGGRIMACTPADTALRHLRTAIVGHSAAARRGRLGNVRHRIRRHRRNNHTLRRDETHLVTIGCTRTVLRVCPHIVCSSCRQSRHVACEAARTACARLRMAAAGGRIMACTPADTALRHLRTAIVGHSAAARRGRLGNVRHRIRRHRRNNHTLRRDETHLVTIGCTRTVLRVCPHIVCSSCRQSRHVACEAARTACARLRMAAAGGRIMACTPADTALRHLCTAIVGHTAAARRGRLGNVRHLSSRHCRLVRVLQGCEFYHITVSSSSTVGGVGAYKVMSACCQVVNVHRKFPNATIDCRKMASRNVRSVACTPADTALRHLCTAIVGHTAAARRGGLLNIRYWTCCHRGPSLLSKHHSRNQQEQCE